MLEATITTCYGILPELLWPCLRLLLIPPLEVSGPGEPLHDLRRAAAQRLGRERRRLAPARAREHAGVRQVQVAQAVAAPGRVDHRARRIAPHPAGAEHVRRAELVVGAVLLDQLLSTRRRQDR